MVSKVNSSRTSKHEKTEFSVRKTRAQRKQIDGNNNCSSMTVSSNNLAVPVKVNMKTPQENLNDQFKQIDREFDVSRDRQIPQTSGISDHIELHASNEDDQFNTDTGGEETDDSGSSSESEDGLITDDDAADYEFYQATQLAEDLGNHSDSDQSHTVTINPRSRNNFEEEDLEYLKGVPEFQTYVQKLVAKEVNEVKEEFIRVHNKRGTGSANATQTGAHNTTKRVGKGKDTYLTHSRVKPPSDTTLYMPALKQAVQENLMSLPKVNKTVQRMIHNQIQRK